MKCKKVIFFIFIFFGFRLSAFKIDRAIISWDGNPLFDDFWPIVSKAWFKIVNVRATLIYIGSRNKKLDQTYGDIIYFPPISGIPTSFQAKAIRLLLPALFPDDFCILSDLDMMPLNREYFFNSVKDIATDKFVVFYPNYYFKAFDSTRYIMCYNVAKGSTFRQIFNVKNIKDIRNLLIEWYKRYYSSYQATCDERILYLCLNNWNNKNKRLNFLNLPLRRINRERWNYCKEKIESNFYFDAHLLRPYKDYKIEIDELLRCYHL